MTRFPGAVAVLVSAILVASDAIVAQRPRTPSARLVAAPLIELPGEIDSSNPFLWDWVGGVQQLFVITSWGGVPVQSSGASVDQLQRGGPVAFTNHPGHGVW